MAQFRRKIIRVGDSFCVTIPKAYVDNGIMKHGKAYTFEVTP